MRRIVLIALVLCLPGCQWAKVTHETTPPHVRAGQSGGKVTYRKVGVGEWVDENGRRHVSDVYVRIDVGPQGARGPDGAKGQTGHPDIKHETTVIIRPDIQEPNTTYDATGGGHRVTVEGWAPPWGTNPLSAMKDIEFPEARGGTTPTFNTRGFDVGEGESGWFSGGGFAGQWLDGGPGSALLWIGGLAVLGGIALAVVAKQWLLGIAVAGGGGVLIGAAYVLDAYPWLPIVGGVLLLGGAIWWLVATRKGQQAADALLAVAKGIEKAPAEAQAVIKDKIRETAVDSGKATAVKATVSAVKAKAGLTIVLLLGMLVVGGCGAEVVFVHETEPVRLAEDVPNVAVWTVNNAGKSIKTRRTLHAGEWLRPDNPADALFGNER